MGDDAGMRARRHTTYARTQSCVPIPPLADNALLRETGRSVRKQASLQNQFGKRQNIRCRPGGAFGHTLRRLRSDCEEYPLAKKSDVFRVRCFRKLFSIWNEYTEGLAAFLATLAFYGSFTRFLTAAVLHRYCLPGLQQLAQSAPLRKHYPSEQHCHNQ